MTGIFRRGAALALSLVVSIAATGGAMAYTTPDFSDVPASHWAYTPVMAMADAGIIKGTGDGQFSPTEKLSAAMFLTLVGRGLYNDEVTTEGAASWYAPYVAAAQDKGLLDGTAITDDQISAEISRYDMAVVLLHAAQGMGVQEQTADTAKIADYGDIPTKYAASVAQVYALGLITGDEAGRFNGTATMTRAEAATVIARLLDLQANQNTEKPAEPTEPETPRTGETITFNLWGQVRSDIGLMGGFAVRFYYKDGRLLGETTSNSDGTYSMDITVDKADYNYYQDLYYIEAYGVVDGKHYLTAEPQFRVRSLNTQLGFTFGWEALVDCIEDHPILFPDIDIADLDK